MASCSFHGDATLMNKELNGSDELIQDSTSPPVTKLSVEKRFGTLEIFKRPLCLVSTDDEMNLQINDEVLHQISRIDVPISVVGVCGVYRTGKSYLMNLLAQERTGFPIGSTIRSHTKGIWAWCKPHPTVSDQVLVLLDTEGFGDAAKGDEEHDMKLFCLTMLMSSALIYNMKGVIDQDALKKLSFVTNLTKQVSVAGVNYSNEEQDESMLQFISPQFVLCLRDFYYYLVDEGELTPDGYMESRLSESSDQQNDNIRRMIRNFFPNRTCFVLAQPAMNKQLECIETLYEESIDLSFREDVKKLQTFVYNLDPKYLNRIARHHWDGKTFDDFLRAYIQDLSRGNKLEYGNAMEGAGRHHNEKLEDTVCRKYKEQMDTLILPQQSKLLLLTSAMKLMHELLAEFRRDAYPYEVLYYEHKAEETMTQMMHAFVDENSRKVIALCLDYLKRKHKEMIENSRGIYRTDGGNRRYGQDFETLLQGYDKEFDNYDRAERCEALQKFNDYIKIEVTEMKCDVKLQEEKNKYDSKIFQLRSELIELGTTVLKKHFDYRVGNDFAKYLTSHEAEKTTLQWLIDTNRITKLQVTLLPSSLQTTSSSYVHKSEQTLLPPSDQTPSSSDMYADNSDKTFSPLKLPKLDISLLTVLLRYVCGLRAPNDLKWKDPLPMDMSIEADITRLGQCRNSIMELTHLDEDELWKKLHEIIPRLGRGVGITDDLFSSTRDAKFDDYLDNSHMNMLEMWYFNDQRQIKFEQEYAATDFFKDSDDGAWTIDEEAVSKLLSGGLLPNAKQLKMICKRFESNSPPVRKVCAYICNTLQMTSHQIKRCWPAYVYDTNYENDTNVVTFVVVKDTEIQLNIDQIFGYNIYELFHESKSAETSEMMDLDIENADSSDDKMKKVEECVSKRSLSLMHSHSNITLIEASTVKSIGYMFEKEIIEKPCVVIYVHKKGYIPLGEEPFPTKLDEFDTDVRECVVSFLGNDKAYERHDKLLMGTSIAHDESAGTLGGFVEHPRHGLCGLTSAHVLYDGPLELIAGVKHWTNVDRKIYVDQPASKIGTRIGEVVCTILRQDVEKVGIEVALFCIQDRLPDSGHFAIDTPPDLWTNDYNSGNIVDKGIIETYKDKTVIKFGSETGRTEAKLLSTKACFKAPFIENCASCVTLNEQLSVDNTPTPCHFATKGDSGALAFVKDNGELKAIGVVVAVSSNQKRCYLTPLSEILDALNEGNTEQVTMKQFEVADKVSMEYE